jgi:hypothetical protein
VLRRRLTALLTLGVMLASMLVLSAPGFADKGGVPNDPSCGIGKEQSRNAREADVRPGASEFSLPEQRPQAVECPPPQQQD